MAIDRTSMEGPADERVAAARSRDEVERRAAMVGEERVEMSLRLDCNAGGGVKKEEASPTPDMRRKEGDNKDT